MQQNIYLFGNPDHQADSMAIKIAKQLSLKLSNVNFIFVKPNEDLPFVDQENVIIMDTVMGIDQVTLITESDLDKFQLPPRFSAHDFDLGFQLKYLKKIDKIYSFNLIALPFKEEINLYEVVKMIKQISAPPIS